jgi:hypothetical protein
MPSMENASLLQRKMHLSYKIPWNSLRPCGFSFARFVLRYLDVDPGLLSTLVNVSLTHIYFHSGPSPPKLRNDKRII